MLIYAILLNTIHILIKTESTTDHNIYENLLNPHSTTFYYMSAIKSVSTLSINSQAHSK